MNEEQEAEIARRIAESLSTIADAVLRMEQKVCDLQMELVTIVNEITHDD